jgi:hypothetical protein
LLAEFIRDDLPALRRLGFSLATQELANARPLEPAVADAASDSLAIGLPDLRVQAAGLLQLIGAETHAPKVCAALIAETDPAAAASLLRCAARFPRRECVAPALAWLEKLADSPDRGAPIDALAALADAQMLDDPGVRTRLAELSRRADPAGLTPAQVERRTMLINLATR